MTFNYQDEYSEKCSGTILLISYSLIIQHKL